MHLRYFIRHLLFVIGYFSICRILFLFINGNIEQIHVGVLFVALINGIRFDITTIGYLLLPIWILLCICSIPRFGKNLRTYAIILIRYYILFAIALSTTIIILDIGFYQEYFTRINYLTFEYLEFADTILSTIYHQFPYNLLIALIPVLIFLEIKLIHKKLKIISIPTFSNMSHWISSTFITLIILTIMVRGGIQSKPLNFSHSNISQYRFANQLVINPIWNLAYSYKSALKEKSTSRMASIPISIEESLKIARNKIDGENSILLMDDFPLLRETSSEKNESKFNVVIILMESFAGKYVGSLGNNKHVTPEFDKLTKEGVLYRKMFATGSRTNRGMTGTLLSFPAVPRFESIFKDVSINQDFSSLAMVLKQRSYSSSFIFSGNLEYDNMKGFLSTQGYDQFYGEKEFDDDAFSTSWGVSDEDLFNKSLEILSTQSEPFFSTILTMSNHPPYLYPKSAAFERIEINDQNESRLNAFKYSDWALGNFISEFKRLPLYERTIFVILGDHGFISDDYNQNTSIELASYHIPCLVIAPGLTPGINNRIASQVDIIPTILDLLGGSFIHHSWGKSLLSPPSINDFAIVVPSGMNHIAGMIKENTFLIYNFLGGTELYAIPNFPKQYQLKKIQKIAPEHLEMEKTMLGYLKMASHTLNTYKCGIILDE